MADLDNPPLQALAAEIADGLPFAQVLIRPLPPGFELRHVDDQGRPPDTLRVVPRSHLRALAQLTAEGAFRPLSSAPSLQSGWRLPVEDLPGLGAVLDQLYPGSVADWFAARQSPPPITHYREFTARQTGMYRLVTLLNDDQAGRMIRACCQRRLCLKRRLWTVAGEPADVGADKSIIPCLEPCAILLEFARKAMRMEQEEKLEAAWSSSEVDTLERALRAVAEAKRPGEREADFSNPLNPRRVQLVLQKLGPAKEREPEPDAE